MVTMSGPLCGLNCALPQSPRDLQMWPYLNWVFTDVLLRREVRWAPSNDWSPYTRRTKTQTRGGGGGHVTMEAGTE